MRHKLLKLIFALFLIGFGQTSLHGQTMYVREISGSQDAYDLCNIRKITFSEGNVIVQKTNNTSGVYALSELRYLNFTELIIGNSNLTVYPNPVIDLLNIDLSNLIGKCKISILTLEGKILQTLNSTDDKLIKLNLNNLSSGIYVLKFENELEIKTVKITKQ